MIVPASAIAGFDLIGRRQEDGKLKLGKDGEGEELDDWPTEVLLCGTVWTLERVSKQTWVKPSNLKNLEWGIYV